LVGKIEGKFVKKLSILGSSRTSKSPIFGPTSTPKSLNKAPKILFKKPSNQSKSTKKT
jgi:hypothetical protein